MRGKDESPFLINFLKSESWNVCMLALEFTSHFQITSFAPLPPPVGGRIDHSAAAESKGSQPQASGKQSSKASSPAPLETKQTGKGSGKCFSD